MPEKSVYAVGDVITCTADANPTANYQWQNMRTLMFYNARTYTITVDMKGFNDTLRCQAQNIISGVVNTINKFIYAKVSGTLQL